jgi:hypothetical protein
MRRGTPPPWWFVGLVAAVLAVCLRALAPSLDIGYAGGVNDEPISSAWFAWVVAVASAIWQGVQVAAKVTLAVLQWSVKALWAFALAVSNAVVALGLKVLAGLKWLWDFLRITYEFVLKPFAHAVWKFVTAVQAWLEKTFTPLIKLVKFVRKWVLDFYAKYIRPILDIIGIGRRVLDVLKALGVDWAKALDAKLADLEARIDAPFRYVVSVLNEVLATINRIVTLDGLFQKLVLIRSIQRDVREVMNVWINAWHSPLTPAEFARLNQPTEPILPAAHIAEMQRAIRHNDNALAARIEEEVADVRRMLRAL